MVCAEKANFQIIWYVKSKKRLNVLYVADISLKIYVSEYIFV